MLSRLQLSGRRFLSTSVSIRQSAAAAEMSESASISNAAMEEYLELVTRAQEKFKEHPDAFTNIDVSQVDFVKEGIWPKMTYKGEPTNLSHLTPFLPIFYGRLGPYGNTGQNKYKSEELVEPGEAKLSLGLSSAFRENYLETFPELEQLGMSEDFEKYDEFCNAIREKFITYLSNNIENHEQLKKYRSYDMVTPDILHKLIERATTKITRVPTNDAENTKYVVAERYVYIKQKETSGNSSVDQKYVSDVDRNVYETEGKVRMDFKVYNEKNERLPWTYSPYRNDIASFRMGFRTTLTEMGHNTRLLLQSGCVIPQLRTQESIKNTAAQSMYGEI